jgi:hypothetical protein
MEGTIYRGWETQEVAVPKGKSYCSSPWCFGSSDNPYELGQILTQKVTQHICD